MRNVVIVGGGIGGLCLAQGLKQAGISVALYERDASADFRGQGYRIHITSRSTCSTSTSPPPTRPATP